MSTGAEVVGLASAGEIAAAGRSVCIVERHAHPGLDNSTHNSGVLHDGIYNPPGTLKARLVQVAGIDLPGLPSSLAIGRYVAAILVE